MSKQKYDSLDEIVYEFKKDGSKYFIVDGDAQFFNYFSKKEKKIKIPYEVQMNMHNSRTIYYGERFLINSDNDEIGYYLYTYNPHFSYIEEIFVHPEYRNQHYGSILSLMIRKELVDKGTGVIYSIIVNDKIYSFLLSTGLLDSRNCSYNGQRVTSTYIHRLNDALSKYVSDLKANKSKLMMNYKLTIR